MAVKAPATSEDQTPKQREALKRVRDDFDLAEKSRRPYVDRWNEWYGLHRNYRRFVRAAAASDPGRDEVINEARREFGAELFVPYVFSVIETATPMLLMNNPRMKVRPRLPQLGRQRAEAVRAMFEERQNDIDYALQLHPIARQGLKYGLGVGKTFWDVEEHSFTAIEKSISGEVDEMGEPKRTRQTGKEVIDGPNMDDVEILDFFWDPAGKNVKTLRYAIHRTWRDIRYIREMVERGPAKGGWEPIDLEAVEKMGSDTDRGAMLKERATAAGLTGYETNQGRLHEVWEWHDGDRVITVLDKQLVVQDKPSPFTHRQLPFQIFRPTVQEGEFVGIGEIEPIVHLQQELNTMRSQRRDNATMVLEQAFLYAEGMVDPADLVVSPGGGIPVFGDPNDVIVPLKIGEIPNSSYQEEQALKGDIEMASGISDITSGSASFGSRPGTETATGIQLVQAAANVRVQLKTKLLTHETVKYAARQWLDLYREKTLTGRQVTVETPDGYNFITVEPEDLNLVREVVPEEDSMAPENTPQKRNDALALYNQSRGNEVVDQRKAFLYLTKAFDVPDGESWILPEQMEMNPQVAQVVGETITQAAVNGGMDEAAAKQFGLDVMSQVMESVGVSQPVGAMESENGDTPSPEGA